MRSAPYQRHSPTSKAAAGLIEGKALTLRRAVYWALCDAPGGLTDEEGQIETGLVGNTYRPRRVELVEGGVVVDSGLTRKTRSGRAAVVWIAARPKRD